ncbi:hypothetical protein LCGC14_3074770 [marine sediment metagenome]|uniref:M23ase beta-sheet core domain-containing protein n=1 Tax=marine sediment metagenome TaxID=412755 RepID=A0A0F8Z5S3_9ZZZZ
MRFIWPLDDHYITRDFYYKASIYIGGQHAAVDLVRLQGDTAGREVRVVADGVVVGDGFDTISGHHIILAHKDGWRSTYRHLVADAPPVVGQHIAQGEVIGNVGSTGWSTGPHLHLDLWHKERKDDTAFSKSGWWAHDPELYLGKEEEDDMPLNQEDLDAINRIVERQVKQRIDDYLLPKMEEKLDERGLVVGGSGGAGLTTEETIEANQEATRRGTG